MTAPEGPKNQRILAYHCGSDSYLILKSQHELEKCGGEVDDVTGVVGHELRFIEQMKVQRKITRSDHYKEWAMKNGRDNTPVREEAFCSGYALGYNQSKVDSLGQL